MTDIMVTMPDLKKEGNQSLKEFYKKDTDYLYFKISRLPRNCKAGQYCHIICNGECIGKHRIIAMRFVDSGEAKRLSDGNWTEGNYIIRDGLSFEENCCKFKIKGFQGFRYVR